MAAERGQGARRRSRCACTSRSPANISIATGSATPSASSTRPSASMPGGAEALTVRGADRGAAHGASRARRSTTSRAPAALTPADPVRAYLLARQLLADRREPDEARPRRWTQFVSAQAAAGTGARRGAVHPARPGAGSAGDRAVLSAGPYRAGYQALVEGGTRRRYRLRTGGHPRPAGHAARGDRRAPARRPGPRCGTGAAADATAQLESAADRGTARRREVHRLLGPRPPGRRGRRTAG